MPLENPSMFQGQKEDNILLPSQTMTPHDYQGPTAPMSGTTTDRRPVQSTLIHIQCNHRIQYYLSILNIYPFIVIFVLYLNTS
ncbi:unnamed protein product [Macrosiphum euphorbiae]|uniref:Uncharacterized protein n=1 Tax=Macrosiphum euphorbiae TaxID=13131 RepID=A0AAV0XWZ3_9HEMI|nr:unnamed protein product [Macrosiphum euphorbiae]